MSNTIRPARQFAFGLALTLLISVLPFSIAWAVGDNQLNNGNLRFGGSSVASVAGNGMLEQPFYYNGSSWRKLTYSSFGLDIAVGVGSGAGNWHDSTVTHFAATANVSPTVDDTAFTVSTAGTPNIGYGTLISSGVYSLSGGEKVSFQHKWELGENDNFVKVTTTIGNDVAGESSALSNMRIWVGTKDDYVGGTDTPLKERGNIPSDGFEEAAASTDATSAIRIKTSDEGVLFYSTTDGVKTSVANCCSFSNVYNQDPDAASTSVTNDGSYAVVLPVGNLAYGETTELVWYYAAARLADLDDAVAAVAAAASGGLGNVTASGADLTYEFLADGDTYWLVVAAGAVAPTAAQVKAGVDYGSETVVSAGSGSVEADVERTFSITGLSESTDYVVYTTTEYDDDSDSGTPDVLSDVESTSFSTAPAPTNSSAGRGSNDDDDNEEVASPAVSPTAGGGTPGVVPPRAATPPQTNLPVTRQGPVLRNGAVPGDVRAPEIAVGGRATQVETEVTNPSTLSLRAGVLSLGVQVQQDQGGVSQAADGTTEIAVRKGARATLSGSGFRPESTVQVFLPLQGSNAKELTRIPVAADGSFNGDAAFATALDEDPLPIGRQVLQLVSVDENGDEVVVDMTVNIAQPPPAPEFNRVDGVIPTQAPGTSIATNGGAPEEVRVSAVEDQKLAVVEGDGWSMAIGVTSENGAVEGTDGGASIKLVRGESARVSGDGFMPGTRADVWLFSDPTLLGTVTIDEEGRFDGEVNIDVRVITAGDHTLQLQGVGEDGYVRAANLGVTVDDPTAGAAEGTAESSLMFIWWVVAAMITLVLAVIFWAAARRRRRAA